MFDPAASPRHRRPRRPRRTPQTWPLPHRRRGCRQWLAALGIGAGAALIVFGILLAVAPLVGAA